LGGQGRASALKLIRQTAGEDWSLVILCQIRRLCAKCAFARRSAELFL